MQKMPAQLFFVPPMECKAVRRVEDLPEGKDWQYEVKFDGYRCIAIKQRGAVELFSRRGNPFLHFDNLFEPLRRQPPQSYIIDGEIVALDADGRIDFNRLQRARSAQVTVHFYVFDVLSLEGRSLLDEPLYIRQDLLRNEFKEGEFIHIPQPLDAPLHIILRKIEEHGFEGIVAKRTTSSYTPGKASGEWLKKKLKQSDEFIVGGYERGRHGIAGIVVGRFDGKKLMYVSQVDDGFVPATRRKLFEKIQGLEKSDCPFVNLPEKRGRYKLDAEKMRKITWVKPKVVVEVAMNEWTPDRHLRHSEFKRLRTDQRVTDVAPYPNENSREK